MNKIWRILSSKHFLQYFLKTFIVIVVLVQIPFIGLSAIVYTHSYKTMEEELGTLNIHNLIRVRDLFDSVFIEAKRMAAHISLDPAVEVFMLSDIPTALLNNGYTRIQELTRIYTNIYSYIESIYVYSETNDYLISNRSRGLFTEFDDRSWYDEYLEQSSDAEPFTLRKRNNIYPYYVSLVRPFSTRGNDRHGAIIVNINVEELGGLIGRTGNTLHEHVLMSGAEGTIWYSHDLTKLGESIIDMELLNTEQYELEEDQTRLVELDGGHFFVTTVQSQMEDRKYVSIFPLEHYSSRMYELRSFIWLLVGSGLMVNLLISMVIAYRAVKPMANLVRIFKDPAGWASRARAGSISAQEMSLTNEIVHALTSKKHLEQQMEQRVVMLSNAQRIALQAQINPHFLYNTLDSIQWTATRLLQRDNEVSEMISDLSDMLRYSIASQNPLVSIAEEIAHAEQYLAIMQRRFHNEFEVRWGMAPAIRNKGIVRLLLQPLIENAFQHGIRPSGRHGIIAISAKQQDDLIIITVKDDGIGIGLDKASQLNEMFKQPSLAELQDHHIGLRNANQRIKLLFGAPFGLRIDPVEPEGAMVTIRIPVVDDIQ